MSFISPYISYLLGWNNDDLDKNNKNLNHDYINLKTPFISSEDLKKIKLKSLKKENLEDNASKIETFEFTELLNFNNVATLEEILSVKLKPTPKKVKQTYYPPRNPVIRQMNEKFGINNENY